ncbi:hypothetical protein [Pandoraea oxalativorans]|uniref:Restriction endonuclease type IV Mrr domain-containing protein n=1 Tax=Pandoraea oxalativorans TaxID=573737 RepID=A0A0E3U644_9BURK|nr:hypothetical protein [Pandoraea oxalativorans]AKC69158.1 hypothetical protein MB84_06245 [Pandoraea oxalativorans]
MVADREYVERVRDYGWEDIGDLWQKVQQCSTPGWDPGKALEYLVLKGFELSGAQVRWPYSVDLLGTKNVEQIDGVVYVANIAAMIECKDYSTPASRASRKLAYGPIAKLQGQLARRPSALIGCLFTTGEFSRSTLALINFTKPSTILCWTGHDIDHCVRRKDFCEALKSKLRACIEDATHCRISQDHNGA